MMQLFKKSGGGHFLRNIASVVILSLTVSTAQAQILSYTSATNGALNSVAANATGTALARVNGDNAAGSPCSTGLSCTNFSSTTTYSSSLAAVEVTCTAAAGYQLNVTGFSADMRRSASGPASVRYAYSTDGGTNWIDQGSNQSPDNASCGTTTTGTWTTSFTVSSANTLKFRVYGFNASSTAGNFQLLNLLINGTVTATGGSGNILSYTTATDGSLNAVAANATGTALTRVNGDNAAGSPCSTGLSCVNFSSTTTYSSTLAAVEVTCTPASGYTLNVSGFSADMRRSATGPASVRYAYSTDGGTTWNNQGTNQSPDNASCGTTTTGTWITSFTVSAPNTLKFRVYGFNASSTAGVLELQNLNITGSVTGSGGGGGTANPKITYYFNNPVDTTVSTGVNAKYLYHCLADTLIAYINRAKYSIDIAQYEYNQTSGYSNIATAVNNAYARGVTVRWIYCAAGNNSGVTTYLNPSIHTLSSPVAGNITPCGKSYNIMHNKFVLIDANSSNPNDAYVWTGSPDWNVTQVNSDFNNVVIIQDSALAHAYTAQFNMMWGSTTSMPNAGASLWGPCKPNSGRHNFTIDGTHVELYFTPSDSTNAHILSTIETANTDLYVGMYTFTSNPDATQLVTAYNSGITVDCIVDQYSDTYSAFATLDSGLGTSHLKVYTGGYIYHNKYAIVDPSNTCSDPMVLTGSHNWTAEADTKNDENTLIIHDAVSANIFYQAFKQDFTTLGGSLSHINAGGGCGTVYRRESNPEAVAVAMANIDHAVIFPNPSSGAFTVQYSLTEAHNVSISVTNTLGQVVSTIVNNEVQEAGLHSSEFRVSVPGMYFVKISADNVTRLFKVIKQ